MFLALALASIAAAQDVVGSFGCTAGICVLANSYMRFGTGSETSVNAWGLFQQPWYYSSTSSTWYKLTFSNYPLDTAIGVGTGGPNWSGTTVTDVYALTNSGSSTDYSGFVVSSSDTTKSTGYGVIVSNRQYTLQGQRIWFENTFSLGHNDSFVRVTTRIINNSSAPLQNLMIWTGTRDDFVGTTDVNIKTRGNLQSGGFVAVVNNSQTSYAIMITNPTDGVLFYSETVGVMTAYAMCCSFSNVYNTYPLSLGPSTVTGTDGSYAAVLPIGNLSVGASGSIVWYYAAGQISSLTTSVVQSVAVAQIASVVVTTNSSTATSSATSTSSSSSTATSTAVSTATSTASSTATSTASSTASSTATSTGNPTGTSMPTITPLFTFSSTAINTLSGGFTVSLNTTYSMTSLQTVLNTQTAPTFTGSSSKSSSASLSSTGSSSNTRSSSSSATSRGSRSPSQSASFSKSSSSTGYMTIAATYSLAPSTSMRQTTTISYSAIPTAQMTFTGTASASATTTPTPSQTPSSTSTLVFKVLIAQMPPINITASITSTTHIVEIIKSDSLVYIPICLMIVGALAYFAWKHYKKTPKAATEAATAIAATVATAAATADSVVIATTPAKKSSLKNKVSIRIPQRT